MTTAYFIIFILAAIPFIEAVAVVPISIVGGFPALPVMVIAFLGNLLTIILLLIFVDKIIFRKRKQKQEEDDTTKRQQRAKSIWNKYGLPGLIFIGPFFVGSHLSAFLAISFGAAKMKTLYMMTASLICWTVILGVAAHYGFSFFSDDDFGFITKYLK